MDTWKQKQNEEPTFVKKRRNLCDEIVIMIDELWRKFEWKRAKTYRNYNHNNISNNNNLFFAPKNWYLTNFFSFSFYDNIRCKKTKATPWLLVNSVSQEVHYYYSLPNLLRWKKRKFRRLRWDKIFFTPIWWFLMTARSHRRVGHAQIFPLFGHCEALLSSWTLVLVYEEA